MPNLDVALPTWPDIGISNVGNSNDRNRWQSDSNGYHHICDHARLRYITADIARHQELKMWLMIGRKTGCRNNLYSGLSVGSRLVLRNIGCVMDWSGKAEKIRGLAIGIACTYLSVQKLFLLPV